MTPSIKRRAVYSAVLGVTLLLMAAGFLLNMVLHAQLLQQYDAALLAKAQALITLTEFDGTKVDFDFKNEFTDEFRDPNDPFLFVMRSRDNQDLGHTPDMDPSQLRPLDPDWVGPWDGAPLFADGPLPDGRRGRMVQVNFLPRLEYGDDQADLQPVPLPDWIRPRLKLLVAWQREGLEAHVTDMQRLLAASFLLLILLVAGILWMAIRQSLKPVDRLADAMEQINVDDLRERIELQPDWVELRPIVGQFQQLLERLDRAFQREKATTANIAHELRTPVAEMRNLAQVAERWPDDPKLPMEFLPLIVDASRRMGRTIEMFLQLARAEAGSLTLSPETILVQPLIHQRFYSLSKDTDAVGKTLLDRLPLPFTVDCDRDLLTGIIDNLLDNAISYSPEGAEIRCEGGEGADGAWIAIINPAPDLDEQDLPVLFDRLWRKSRAGSDARHRGLGLTLVKAYAALLELEIDTSLSAGGDLNIRVRGFGVLDAGRSL